MPIRHSRVKLTLNASGCLDDLDIHYETNTLDYSQDITDPEDCRSFCRLKSDFFTQSESECWCKESNAWNSTEEGAVSGRTICGDSGECTLQ